MRFLGRKKELQALEGLLQKSTSSLVVIRGRRRIGKSRLAEEFAKQFPKAFILSGIPPEIGVTAADQRKEFLRQLQEYRLPIYESNDWGQLFFNLAQECKTGRILVVLDEITWMGSQDPTFLPKLKTAWDRHFKKNPQLVLIVSGSNSAWINKNILSSTGFFGRLSLRIHLEELSLPTCNTFWEEMPGQISPYDKFKILSVTGGVPRYLEELKKGLTAEGNIRELCFSPDGLLVHEFDQIFHDLFRNRGDYYKQIITNLVDRHLSQTELAKKMGRKRGGDLSEAIYELTESGFLARDYTWSLKSKKNTKISKLRVRDNYIRFYLKYIKPNRPQIDAGQITSLPSGWYGIMGYQFENLVINNSSLLVQLLNINPDEVLHVGPYLQTKTTRRAGCQIDYLIQTKYHSLFPCEIKFHQDPVGMEVIDIMQQKLERLQLPRGFSYRPVLIHVNGVTPELADAGYFAHIIDFSQFLQPRA